MVPTRPLASVAAVALVALSLLALLPDFAYACSCGGGGVPFEVLAKGDDAGAVFSGEVLNISEGEPLTVSFRASEVWKGPQQETLEVRTPSHGVLCGYPFKERQEYLVYAYGKEEPFKVSLCGETKLLSKADANLRVLGDEPLPDTSGGVAGLGVLGLVTVAAATATLLLLKRLLKSR